MLEGCYEVTLKPSPGEHGVLSKNVSGPSYLIINSETFSMDHSDLDIPYSITIMLKLCCLLNFGTFPIIIFYQKFSSFTVLTLCKCF